MGVIKKVVLSAFVAFVAWKVWEVQQEPPLPPLDPNPWWGPGSRQPEDTAVREFKISIPEKDLQDMKTRLALPLRLTPGLENANFTYGINSETLTTIVNHWRHNYDWRQREIKLNTYKHYKTRIEGLDIHFLRASANVGANKNVKVVPLMLIHGWPGSIVEFYRILPLLTSPQPGSDVVFEVICPSIPGYGFSQGSSKPGLGKLETAQIFLKLMKRLGFEKFYLQGGDWGAAISADMATMYPQNVLGAHLNMVFADTPGINFKLYLGSVLPSGVVMDKEDEDKIYPLTKLWSLILRETGYLHLQASKPDTIGAVLDQHPVGLAAYILEKFGTLTHGTYIDLPDGGLLQKDFPIPLDDVLDNISFYWFTSSGTTAARFYAENLGNSYFTKSVDKIPCRVPVGLTAFPQEMLNLPKNLAAYKYYDIVTFTKQPSGGHFAAMEEPKLLADDLHKFLNKLLTRTQPPSQ